MLLEYLAVAYLAAFPLASVVCGWTALTEGLAVGHDRLAPRRIKRWRSGLAFFIFGVAWLLVMAACMLLFGHLSAWSVRDPYLQVTLFTVSAWIACGLYWGGLMLCCYDVLHLPLPQARRVAGVTLLWNLLLTLPYVMLVLPRFTNAQDFFVAGR